MKPIVSICIPTYNNITTLKRLLHSIDKQTFKDYEVIISDDSTNNQIKEFISTLKDDRLIYHINHNKVSSTANWNESMKMSRGKYIKIMHHDDWFTFPNSLEKMINMFEKNPEVFFAFSGSRQVEVEKVYDRFASNISINGLMQSIEYLFLDNCIGAPSATMFKSQQIYFDEELKWLVDVEFYIRYLKKYKTFSYTTEPLISIGISNQQITNSCFNNEELKLFEYGYTYMKLNLEKEKKNREKLIDVFLCYNKKYSDLKRYGINIWDYGYIKVVRMLKNIKFYFHKLKEYLK